MHPRIQDWFATAAASSGLVEGRALEVGGKTDGRSLLRVPALASFDKVCLNLRDEAPGDGIEFVRGNANDMSMFRTGSFDVVASNAMLEHDRCFWKSVDEMKRVLRPGGLLFLGLPGFVEGEFNDGTSTVTYRYHGGPDYWRFSDVAFRDVLLDGLDDVTVEPVLVPPRIMGTGRKPFRSTIPGNSEMLGRLRGALPEDRLRRLGSVVRRRISSR